MIICSKKRGIISEFIGIGLKMERGGFSETSEIKPTTTRTYIATLNLEVIK
jgi:hypothetical protein